MNRNIIENPFVRTAAAVLTVTALSHAKIEPAQAQVTEVKLVDCQSENGSKANSASLTFPGRGEFLIGNTQSGYKLSAEKTGFLVTTLNQRDRLPFYLAPRQPVEPQGLVYVINTKHFHPEGSDAMVTVVAKDTDWKNNPTYLTAEINAVCDTPGNKGK